MKFSNCYVPYFLSDIKLYLVSPYSITQRSYPNALGNVSDTEVTDIMQCAVKTARNVDSQTQLAVLGTNNIRMLYGGGDGHLDYTPRYFLGLHNNLMRLLRRALRYIQRGIHVPLSDNVKVLLDCTIIQSVKRVRLKY